MDKPNIRDAIDDLRLAKRFIKKTEGIISAPITDAYLEYMKSYEVYCIEEEKTRWNVEIIRCFEIIYILEMRFDSFNDKEKKSIKDIKKQIYNNIYKLLNTYEIVGELLKQISCNVSWKEIKSYLDELVLDNYEWFKLGSMVLEMSPRGVEFIENAFDVRILNKNQILIEKYLEIKEGRTIRFY